MYVCLCVCVYNPIMVFMFTKRFIIRHWLMQLQRLRSLKIYSQQSRNSWEPMMKVTVGNLVDLRPKKNWNFSSNPKVGKDQCPSSSHQTGGVPSYLREVQTLGCIQLTEWGPPTLERELCFTQSSYSNVILILMDTPRMLDQRSELV